MAKKPRSASSKKPELWYIGIGSSAGGLEAARELVKNLPSGIPAAFIIAQHLSPQYKSLLSTLIRRETEQRVEEIRDNVKPQAGVIYVTPSNCDVVLERGRLRLLDPNLEVISPKPSVDRFFTSLGEEAGERAVGIILSGTGSDGAKGMQVIRASGGITLAQDVATAKYDGMPSSSIETGCVDLVLSPLQIATHLARILSSPRDFGNLKTEITPNSPVQDLLDMLLERTRIDFRQYKINTTHRRISRRLRALGLKDQREYVAHCRENPSEIDMLFRDLLISVTRFFRDQSEYDALKGHLKQLWTERSGDQFRIWVAGCATGEEAYSVAILLAEVAGGIQKLNKLDVKIFATDIDKTALRMARRGKYPRSIAHDVPPDFLSRYFDDKSDSFCVIDELKELVVFSEHNMCQDPPFMKLNLICCRNVLIYFDVALQRTVLNKMHFALLPRGCLFLGTAETINSAEDMFVSTSAGARVFRPRKLSRAVRNTGQQSARERRPAGKENQLAERPTSFEHARNKTLFENVVRWLGKDALLVGADHAILRIFGDLGRYVSFTENTKLKLGLDMLDPMFSTEAKVLVSLALKHNDVRAGREQMVNRETSLAVKMIAYPLELEEYSDTLALLVFQSVERKSNGSGAFLAEMDEKTSEHIRRLEKEVDSSREAHRQITEELETSNEELQSLNEELQSANEELQSANEELETANEELQSTNEELITVNEELHVNTAVLMDMTQEQEAIVRETILPLIVVDSALRIKTANGAAISFLDIPDVTFNPHISQIDLPKQFPALAELCDAAITSGKNARHSAQSEGQEYAIRVHPIIHRNGVVSGATLTIFGPRFLDEAMVRPQRKKKRAKSSA